MRNNFESDSPKQGLVTAYAVAARTPFLEWQNYIARRVWFVDGDITASVVQERLHHIVAAEEHEPPHPDYLRILTPDLPELGIGNIASSEWQARIELHLEAVDMLILDSLTTLCQTGDETAADGWEPVQAGLLQLRQRHISVLITHHAGRSGNAGGTSKREDVPDAVISLQRPADFEPSEGAPFEVHYEKSHGFNEDDARPFEVKMETRDGRTVCPTKFIEDVRTARSFAISDTGLTHRQIVEEPGPANRTLQKRWSMFQRSILQGVELWNIDQLTRNSRLYMKETKPEVLGMWGDSAERGGEHR